MSTYGYIAFFNGQKIEIRDAASLYDAKRKAVIHFKPNKRQEHNVLVMLAEKDGEVVAQTMS